MDVATDVGRVRAESQLDGGAEGEPPPLHPERHETGAQHRGTHVEVQIGDLDIRLPEIHFQHRRCQFVFD